MEEIWVSIKGHEGAYEVSSLGNIRGLDRVCTYTSLGKVLKRVIKGKPLKPTLYNGKYLFVNLSGVVKAVHRLVAENFHSNPENLPIVMHLDNNKVNNSASNLKWGTLSENAKQAYDDGLLKGICKGSGHIAAKYSEELYSEIKARLETESHISLAKEYGLPRQTLYDWKNKRRRHG